MQTIYIVIYNNGDGSNGLEWYCDPSSITRLMEKADRGDEVYASGDGLQVRELKLPDYMDLYTFVSMNNISWADAELVENG